MTGKERVVDKVLKLLAKAESTTPAEALTAKATALMVREAIDEAMLADAQGKEHDEIVKRDFTFKGGYAQAQQQLAGSVAHCPVFAREYLALVRRFGDFEMWAELRRAFEVGGIEVAP